MSWILVSVREFATDKKSGAYNLGNISPVIDSLDRWIFAVLLPTLRARWLA